MTPTGSTRVTALHRIHLFFSPHNRMPYLRHIHDVDERTIRRLDITTTMPSTSTPST